MFQIENYVHDISDVPTQWIFEHYLKLSQPLTGQRVMLQSAFNSADKSPSMSIYHNSHSNKYRYKDFSTGTSGSAFDLMHHMWNISIASTYSKIITDYREYLSNGGKPHDILPTHTDWKVVSYMPRSWNKNDVSFWAPYNIGSNSLESHNVRPMASFIMQRLISDQMEQHEISDPFMYGYFTQKGELYKVYRPKDKKHKFYKVSGIEYIQGWDQLKKHDYLLITKALKDIMCIKTLELKLDLLAPDSENTMLKEETIIQLRSEYKAIAIGLDSDTAGIASMMKYRDKYNIPIIYYPLAKDPSDAMKFFGKKELLKSYVPLLHTALNKYEKSSTLITV